MLIFLALLVPALCATLRGQISGLQHVDFSSTTFVLRDLLTSHRERRYVNVNGTFEFYNLDPKNRYLLTLDSDTLELPWSYVVGFKEDQEAGEEFDIHRVVHGRPLDTLSPSVPHPIVVAGAKRTELVTERNDFSIFKFFLQPTVMLSLGALVLVTYLPTWLDNLDPELLEELQKNQLRPDAEKLQNFDLAKSIADRRSQQN